MQEYDFTLKFNLKSAQQDGAHYLEPLAQAGCDDAVVGIGQLGRISLNFIRQAETEQAAITSALDAIQQSIPGATLLETASHTTSTAHNVADTAWHNGRHQPAYDEPYAEQRGFAQAAAHYG